MDYAKINLELGRRAASTPEARADVCFPLIEQVHRLAVTARQHGLLALDDVAPRIEHHTLRCAMLMVLDALDPEYISAALEKHLALYAAEGAALLGQLICVEGALCIQQGMNPRLILDRLILMLGPELEKEANLYFATEAKQPQLDWRLVREYLEQDARGATRLADADPTVLECATNRRIWAALVLGRQDVQGLAAYVRQLGEADQMKLLSELPGRTACSVVMEIRATQPNLIDFYAAEKDLACRALRLAEEGEIYAGPLFAPLRDFAEAE